VTERRWRSRQIYRQPGSQSSIEGRRVRRKCRNFSAIAWYAGRMTGRSADLAPHLAPREIPRILFQRCDAISPVALEIEPIQRLACGLVKAGIQQACQPVALSAERAADDVL